MSDYLIKDIDAADKIDVRFNTRVFDAGGEGCLQYLVLEDSHSSHRERVKADALFVLIGARPYTDWLPDEIQRDRWGFVLTGIDLSHDPESASRDRLDLETSMSGVFAAGDVRHGSLKRVASAVGEGSPQSATFTNTSNIKVPGSRSIERRPPVGGGFDQGVAGMKSEADIY